MHLRKEKKILGQEADGGVGHAAGEEREVARLLGV